MGMCVRLMGGKTSDTGTDFHSQRNCYPFYYLLVGIFNQLRFVNVKAKLLELLEHFLEVFWAS